MCIRDRAEEGGLLVAEIARYRNAGQVADGRAVDLGRGLDGREHRLRDAQEPEDLGIPVERGVVEEEGPARVGDVGDVDAARRAAGQVPDAPGVDGAEQEIARLGPGPGAL